MILLLLSLQVNRQATDQIPLKKWFWKDKMGRSIYQFKKYIPRPAVRITRPASRCMYFSLDLNFRKDEPKCARYTINIMVAMVVIPKKRATDAIPTELLWTAGMNNIGIKTSHGPKTKMINKTQGVNFVSSTFFSNPWLSWCLIWRILLGMRKSGRWWCPPFFRNL